MRALVVDPGDIDRTELAKILRQDRRIGAITEASDAVAALHLLNSGESFDVVFLDIRMPGLDGLELGFVFAGLPKAPLIVYVTSFDDRAIGAFEIGAVDYLLKPVANDRVFACVDRVVALRAVQSAAPGAPRSAEGGNGKVFICHSSGDKDQVRALFERLRSDGFDCWFDEFSLLPGQDWEHEIGLAIRECEFVLACVSQASINRRGYIHKELKHAIDVADEQPEGATFLIPVRLEPCTLPQRLRRWQWVDLYAPTGYERLLVGLRSSQLHH
jgi:CheY-like chemotaxis protein